MRLYELLENEEILLSKKLKDKIIDFLVFLKSKSISFISFDKIIKYLNLEKFGNYDKKSLIEFIVSLNNLVKKYENGVFFINLEEENEKIYLPSEDERKRNKTKLKKNVEKEVLKKIGIK